MTLVMLSLPLRKYYILQLFRIIGSFQGYIWLCVWTPKYWWLQSNFPSSKMLLLSFFPLYDKKQNSIQNRSRKKSWIELIDNSSYFLSILPPPLFSSRKYEQFHYRYCRLTIQSLNRRRLNKLLRILILFAAIEYIMPS